MSALGTMLMVAALGASPTEDEIFGGAGDESPADDNATLPPSAPGGPGDPTAPGGEAPGPFAPSELPEPGTLKIAVPEDPLAIGGQLYLRLGTTISDRGGLGDQALSMPNLLDLYLDARPEERVRGFISGRLSFDPTLGGDDASLASQLGQSRAATKVILDQMWLKTDIAHAVFLTIGQERIKWGANRLWSPNDFINARRRDPLALFDERTGVPMVKVHIPYETLNVYLVGLLGEANQLDAPGGAFRVELAFEATEIALSGIAGQGRRTAFGFDLSSALGDIDVTAEVSLTDDRDRARYRASDTDVSGIMIPDTSTWGAWKPRVAGGIQYAFKPNDDDVMYLGLEYFWNSTGVDDTALYPWMIVQGDYEPFYLGQHYLGLSWAIPQPGDWDDTSFTVSAIGNLSDTSFIARLDYAQTVHTRLKLEAYAQGHFGTRGGELRFALDVPELPPIPDVLPDGLDAVSVPAPAVLLGLNLRLVI